MTQPIELRPDLVIPSLGVGLEAGALVVTLTVRNAGDAPAPASRVKVCVVQIDECVDGTRVVESTSFDFETQTAVVDALPAGTGQPLVLSFLLAPPMPLPPDTHGRLRRLVDVIAVCDVTRVVRESQEGNNGARLTVHLDRQGTVRLVPNLR